MDVHYIQDSAVAAGILFNRVDCDQTLLEKSIKIENIQPYESGSFYKRELPCLTALIDSLDNKPTILIVDGYVYLNNDYKHGLGYYLYTFYNKKIPVIGVAKNNFKENTISKKLCRGTSKKPLYITSVGIDLEDASNIIENMHGTNRFPTLLKKVDSNCRNEQA